MTPDDDAKALGEAGYDLLHEQHGHQPDAIPLYRLHPGDLVIRRRRPPAPVESECVRMHRAALSSAAVDDEGAWHAALARFEAALAREIAAAEQRGYDKAAAQLFKDCGFHPGMSP